MGPALSARVVKTFPGKRAGESSGESEREVTHASMYIYTHTDDDGEGEHHLLRPIQHRAG
jgi:hypothetical protein